jgi:hypothetical protein
VSDRLQRVIDNYELKLRMGATGRLTEDEIQRRVIHFGSSAAEEDQVLRVVREVLFRHGIPTIAFPFYHAFSRELGKLSRSGRTGPTVNEELAQMADKWVMRGLDRQALLDVALIVFHIVIECYPAELPSQ